MSAILGCFTMGSSGPKPGTIEIMTACLAPHHGRDGRNHYTSGPVSLGYCAQHTTAESSQSTQPLANDGGNAIIVFDGYLQNPDELRSNLVASGARPRNRSDAELALHAYLYWPEDWLNRLEGEFSLIIWDNGKQRLIAARDHQGLRPLFYCVSGQTLYLATEIKAILSVLDREPRLNMAMLAEVMSDCWYTADETIWQGINRILPAHALVATGNGLQFTQYWQLPLGNVDYRSSFDNLAEQHRDVLQDCVRRATRSSHPVAFEVSGGLDSTSLFCLADRLDRSSSLPCPSIAGYTLRGPQGTRADEIEFPRLVGRELDRRIHEEYLFLPPIDWFSRFAAESRDVPPYPNGAMSVGMEQAIARDGAKVVINGIGGDEWLQGSQFHFRQAVDHANLRDAASLFRLEAGFHGKKRALKTALGYGMTGKMPRAVIDLVRAIASGRGLHEQFSDMPLIAKDLREEMRERRQSYLQKLPKDPFDRLRFEKWFNPFSCFLHDLNTRQRARNGLEIRYPFLTRKFIEFSLCIPEKYKMRGGLRKVLHRHAMVGIMPDALLERRTKAEFSAAYYHYDGDMAGYSRSDFGGDFGLVASCSAAEREIQAYCNAAIDKLGARAIWSIRITDQILRVLRDSCSTEGLYDDR